MTITIAGCGALGSIFASGFVEHGFDVQIYQRKGATLDALAQQGGVRLRPHSGKERLYPVKTISHEPSNLSPSELIIVLVKSYHTSSLRPIAPLLRNEGLVLTLQNGLGNGKTLADIFGKEHIAQGVATYGAYTIAPGRVQEAGSGIVSLGPLAPGHDMSRLADIFTKAGFTVQYDNDPGPYIWRKLAVNAMINTVAALTRMKNGKLKETPSTLDLMKRLGLEAAEAARREGILLDFDKLWDFLLDNLGKTASNKASMLQDVESGRRTEIDSISGGVLNYAEGKEDFPFTRAVYKLIKGIDERLEEE